MTSTCTGAAGLMSRMAIQSSPSSTRGEGISPATILQKIQSAIRRLAVGEEVRAGRKLRRESTRHKAVKRRGRPGGGPRLDCRDVGSRRVATRVPRGARLVLQPAAPRGAELGRGHDPGGG